MPADRTDSVVMSKPYDIPEPEGGWVPADSIVGEERSKLRPIAETLAMLDGNAFFGMAPDFWAQYLPEAKELYEANGGDNGWAGRASFGPRPAN